MVVIVLAVLRQNLAEEVVAELFNISQPTVSQLKHTCQAVIKKALPEQPVTPALLRSHRTVLIDGMLAATWDYDAEGLFSGKHHDTGLRLQVLADLKGRLLAVSEPCPAKTHDSTAVKQWNITDMTPDDVLIIGDPASIGCGVFTGTRSLWAANSPRVRKTSIRGCLRYVQRSNGLSLISRTGRSSQVATVAGSPTSPRSSKLLLHWRCSGSTDRDF
jgi:hypothetical protein